ncbi:MAG: tetratricopeptide repeat protein [Blastocatellia bacterium]|nr:tetratricopeptide repeat protein [Blastocatellia bacterium]
MKLGKSLRFLGAMAVAILLTVMQAEAAGKAVPFTTKSKEAEKYVAEAIRGVESFQFPQQINGNAKKAVAADPDFAFAHYLVAVTSPTPAAGQPEMEKALELVKKASEGERRYLEAVSLVRAQKAADALKIFQELAVQYPEDRKVRMMIGQISLNTGQPDQAQAAFEQALKLDGSTPRVHAMLGTLALLKDDYKKARDLYGTAIAKKAPATAPFLPYYGTAYTYVYEGNLAAALKTLQTYRELYEKTDGFPELPAVFVWNSIARLQLENGRLEEALKSYEAGYKTVPGSTMNDQEKTIWMGRMHHGRGRVLAKMGKHEEAWKEAEYIKKLIEEGGERGKEFWPSYHYIAGYLKLENGDYKAAVEHLKQSRPGDEFHLLLLARAYDKTGETAEAQKIYQQIVDSKQNNLERALSYGEAKKKLKKA